MSKRSRSAHKSMKSKKGPSKRGRSAVAAQSASLKSSKIAAARMVANAVTAGFIGLEKKFLDTALAETALAATSALTGGEYDPAGAGCTGCLSCPAQGDTEQSRDGKRIVIDSLILKGFVVNGPTASAAVEGVTKVFVAVILDTQTNVAQLNSEDVFKSLGGADAFNASPLKNLLFGKRFRILKSQVFDLTHAGTFAAAANFGGNGVRREFDWYIPFKGGLPVNLNAGTTANVANVIDNSLHIVAFSTLAGSAIGYNARIRFQG